MVHHPLTSHALVVTQLVAIGVCVFPFADAGQGPIALLTFSALGLALGIYTLWHNRPGNFDIYPEPKQGCHLVTSGPYRFIRHPMYLSLLLMMLGAALYSGHAFNLLSFCVLALVVAGKATIEEKALHELFENYDTYAARTKRIIPGVF